MQPVYELAGQQEDPLAEEVLAILFSDRPERETTRPGDSRIHWQWMAREAVGQTSRVWLSFAQPITDDTVDAIQSRSAAALDVLVPTFATSVETTATQRDVDTIALAVVISRPLQEDLTIGLLVSGGTDA